MSGYRHEYKYLLDAPKEALLRLRVSAVMKPDPHVRADGSYLIRSVYFDDLRDTCLNENIGGTDPRSKYRIRYYNDSPDRVRLEKKSKVRGMCLKESCAVSPEECRLLLRGEVPLPGGEADGVGVAVVGIMALGAEGGDLVSVGADFHGDGAVAETGGQPVGKQGQRLLRQGGGGDIVVVRDFREHDIAYGTAGHIGFVAF